MLWSIVCALVAGAAMSVQGVMNTRLNQGIGLLEANVLVQGLALVLSLLAVWWFGRGDFRQLTQVPWGYWLGGALGIVITITVMLSVQGLRPAPAISTILLSQLAVAALIDGFGWLGTEASGFRWQQLAGVALMAGGVLLMKLGKA